MTDGCAISRILREVEDSCDGFCFFFFNDTATTEIYTLSLHDALPICGEFAFPVNLGLNEVAAHFTPVVGDETIAEGILKKIGRAHV